MYAGNGFCQATLLDNVSLIFVYVINSRFLINVLQTYFLKLGLEELLDVFFWSYKTGITLSIQFRYPFFVASRLVSCRCAYCSIEYQVPFQVLYYLVNRHLNCSILSFSKSGWFNSRVYFQPLSCPILVFYRVHLRIHSQRLLQLHVRVDGWKCWINVSAIESWIRFFWLRFNVFLLFYITFAITACHKNGASPRPSQHRRLHFTVVDDLINICSPVLQVPYCTKAVEFF